MAILRGGRRIGNFDIRLGLPRDKSLVDVAKDPRLKRQPGGAGTIQRFLSQVNQGEGFARTNRYIVRINPPSTLKLIEAQAGPPNQPPQQISAELTSFVSGRKLDDNAQISLRLNGGAKASIWSSQIAPGNENHLQIRIYGEKGGLEWCQEDPNYLYFTQYGHPKQKITRGGAGALSAANEVSRIPPGHPEGYLEGFANIYSDVSKTLFDQINKQNHDKSNDCYPTIYDGIEGMKFIETILESSKNNSKWVQFNSKINI